jgi:hypothetical protein
MKSFLSEDRQFSPYVSRRVEVSLRRCEEACEDIFIYVFVFVLLSKRKERFFRDKKKGNQHIQYISVTCDLPNAH